MELIPAGIRLATHHGGIVVGRWVTGNPGAMVDGVGVIVLPFRQLAATTGADHRTPGRREEGADWRMRTKDAEWAFWWDVHFSSFLGLAQRAADEFIIRQRLTKASTISLLTEIFLLSSINAQTGFASAILNESRYILRPPNSALGIVQAAAAAAIVRIMNDFGFSWAAHGCLRLFSHNIFATV